ncbi:Rrf2 family transcriptional regulator [Cognatishimia sp. WU-CL00825]|uniref:Rrf2 family transcriptional regulator n=1 Tax=Cognatishimia sp. WU-CL00825 TaxID=3127658 RepID=UPI0031033D02
MVNRTEALANIAPLPLLLLNSILEVVVNSQLTIAAHILAVLAHHKDDGAVTSEVLAQGFGTNPVVIRRVLSRLKKAGLISGRAGAGGGSVLSKSPEKITLRDAYEAISDEASPVLVRHRGHCDDGAEIGPVIADYLNELSRDAELAMLRSLEAVNVNDLTKEIGKRLKPTT